MDTLQTLQDAYPAVKWRQVTEDTYQGMGSNGAIFRLYRAPDGVWMAEGAPHFRSTAVWDETEEHPTPREALNELVEMGATYTDVLGGVAPGVYPEEAPARTLWNSWGIFLPLLVIVVLSFLIGSLLAWCYVLLGG